MCLSTDRVIANLVPMISFGNINKGNNLLQLQSAFSGGLDLFIYYIQLKSLFQQHHFYSQRVYSNQKEEK